MSNLISRRVAAIIVGGAVAGVCAMAASAQESGKPIKIGFIATMSGALGSLGEDGFKGFTLALEQNGNKLGGRPVEVVAADDHLKVDEAVQLANKFTQSDKVDLVFSSALSNVLMGIARPVTDAGTLLISASAGPTPLSGEKCNPLFFNTSNTNEAAPAAVGELMNKRGIKSVFVMAPNYEAGLNVVEGFKRAFKGEVKGQVLTTLNQPDYQAELAQARAAKPDAVFAFYFGGMAPTFIKQYSLAGMGAIPLYTQQAIDSTTLPAIGNAAVGTYLSNNWNADLNNPANNKFVADFKAKHGKEPTSYAAWAYDTVLLLDAAIKDAGGSTDAQKLRSALLNVKFDSIRGRFGFNPKNQFPVTDFYAIEVVKGPDGKPAMAIGELIGESRSDAVADKCNMPSAN